VGCGDGAAFNPILFFKNVFFRFFCSASFTDALAGFADALADPLAGFADALADPLAGFADALAGFADALADPLAAFADALADPLAGFADALADPLADPLVDPLAGFADALACGATGVCIPVTLELFELIDSSHVTSYAPFSPFTAHLTIYSIVGKTSRRSAYQTTHSLRHKHR
jgi:hypothetical protein